MTINIIFQRLLRRYGPLAVHHVGLSVFNAFIPDRLSSVLGNLRPKSFVNFSFITEPYNRRGIFRTTKGLLHPVIDVRIVIYEQWVVMRGEANHLHFHQAMLLTLRLVNK